MENHRLDGIQGLRAIAALLVVAGHSVLSLVEKAGLGTDYQSYGWRSGAVGVRLFFAISGFVMVYTSFNNFSRPGAARSFFVKRFLRIIPLYYVTTALYAAKLALQHNGPTMREFALSALFVPYLDPQGLFRPIYGLGWTLNYEMFFYALFSVSLLFYWRSGIAAVSIVLLSLILVGLTRSPVAETGFCQQWLIFVSDPILTYFIIGMIIGCVRMLTRRWLPGASIASALLLCIVLSLTVVLVDLTDGKAFLATVTLASSCVALVAFPAAPAAFIATASYLRVVRSIGDSSYSIYLTHSFLLGPAARGWHILFGTVHGSWPLFVMAMLIGSSLLGQLSFHYVEVPLMRLLRNRATRQSVHTLPVVATVEELGGSAFGTVSEPSPR